MHQAEKNELLHLPYGYSDARLLRVIGETLEPEQEEGAQSLRAVAFAAHCANVILLRPG